LKQQFKGALSIGWSPVYDNPTKTIEVFLIHDFKELDLYGEELEVKLHSFIRAETLFSTFTDLIIGINLDIQAAID
jgi:riboflavin kinase